MIKDPVVESKKDLAAGFFFALSATMFLTHPTGTLALDPLFDTAVNYNSDNRPYSATTEDFNGDRHTDPAVANYNSDNECLPNAWSALHCYFSMLALFTIIP